MSGAGAPVATPSAPSTGAPATRAYVGAYARANALHLSAAGISEEAIVALAREDPAAFAEYVLRTEATNEPVVLSRAHEAWHDAMSKHERLVIWSHVEAGKTSLISIGRVLWELGRNPNLRIAIVCASAPMASKILTTIQRYIETSEELHRVFPLLRRSRRRRDPWNSLALTVERTHRMKDPSVTAAGIRSPSILGSRYDLLIFDDVLTYTNTRTFEAMDEVTHWARTTPLGRLTTKARVWCVGNVWNPRDFLHKLTKESGYRWLRIPVANANGIPLWPEAWPAERIARAREDLGPSEFARQLLCVPANDEGARFSREAVDLAIRRGEGYRCLEQIDPDDMPAGWTIWTGVDLAIGLGNSNDYCAFVTVLLWADGTRQVVRVKRARMLGEEIVREIEHIDQAFGGTIVVENNAAQDYLVQFARRDTRATIVAFRTGRQKAHPEAGVEGIATELAAGKWVIPSSGGVLSPGVEFLVQGMFAYRSSPRVHTSDPLMALYFARETLRRYERRLGRRPGDAPTNANDDASPAPTPAPRATTAPMPLPAPLPRGTVEAPAPVAPSSRTHPAPGVRVFGSRGGR